MNKRSHPSIVKRLTTTPWDKGTATVLLDGEQIAELHSTPGWIYAVILGQPYGGGKGLHTALKTVAIGYQVITGKWDA